MRVIVFEVSEAVDCGEMARAVYENTASVRTALTSEFLKNFTVVNWNTASALALVEISVFVGREWQDIFVGWNAYRLKEVVPIRVCSNAFSRVICRGTANPSR